MNDTVTQMAAISAAIRMLLSGHRVAKPRDLLIAASTSLSEPLVELMMAHAAAKRSTFLALFREEDGVVLLEKILVVDASTKKSEINIGAGQLIRKPDGSFAILSANRDAPYEYSLSNSGRRLVRRAANGPRNRASMELEGLKALMQKAAMQECQEEALQRSVYNC
jgi:hypothetical protein